MIALIIIGYLFIAVCTSVGMVLCDFKDSAADNIETFLEWRDDELTQFIGMGLFWPITLIICFVVLFLPFIFKKLVIAIDRLITNNDGEAQS